MASWWVTEDPDRLKYPMLRTNPKGEPGRFRRASWDEALDFIAGKLAGIKEQWGPEAVAFTCHHDPNTVFYWHLLRDLYGSPNMYTHTSGCEQDRRSACLTLFGHVFPMHDFINSRYVILWGMNNLGANQGLWESRELIEAKKRGCKLVVVDPNFTETAQKADEWLPIRPGADGALALAMCHVIIEGDLFDRDFVSRHCEGFDGFREHLRERGYTPEWAEPITGIEAGRIRRIAREFATTKPAMSAIFKGSGYYTNGADAGRACYLLDAICGEVDKPGNLVLKDWAPLGAPVEIPEDAKAAPSKDPLHVAMGYPARPGSAQLPPARCGHRREPLSRQGAVRAVEQPGDERSEPGSGEGDVRPPGARGDLRAVHERDRAGRATWCCRRPRSTSRRRSARACGRVRRWCCASRRSSAWGRRSRPTRSSRRWPKRWGSAGTFPTRNGRTGASW